MGPCRPALDTAPYLIGLLPLFQMSSKCALITGITGQDGSYLAELLLEKGVSANGKDGDKYPPLATAIFYGLNSDIARVLIDHDASVNRKVGAFMPDEKDGQSLLELARHQAAKHNNSGTQGIVDLLIQAGAKDRPDTGDKN